MRWWVSAVLAACTRSSPPAPPPRIACPTIAVTCAAAPDDDAALALIGQRCTPCHAEGGRAGLRLDTLGALRAAAVESALASCEMPLAGPLSAGERGQLVAWARCAPR